jgi:3D (Asp-Asp-Asp) domain-containing protein
VTPTPDTQIEVWVTGYSGEEGFDEHTTTSNGTVPSWGTCAVDPTVIPYGSIIYSRNYEVMCGRYLTALDSGSAVKGYHLDMWTETNAQSASLTGYETVRILRRGWDDWLVRPEEWGLKQ